MDSIILNLKRASIEIILLTLLSEEDMYGYKLVQEIKKRSDGKISLLEGSMYTVLNRLKDNNDVSMRSELVGVKMVRVYYHLTDSGRNHLKSMRTTYNEYVNIIDAIISKDV